MPHAFASSLVPMAALQATNFETARVEPHYRTGQSGEDLFSGNYHWSLPIVSLPGRAGHDLNLTLVYNSLVWTKAGSSIRYDMDYGWPSPGFRFGFPVFYGPYINSTTNRQAYILITLSGEAIEMRKVGGYETYEAEDSSYLQLKLNTTLGAWVLTTANGTQFIYGETLEIKDRNDNRITATYDANGLMDTITDTLGRQILLEYGEYGERTWMREKNDSLTTLASTQYSYDSYKRLQTETRTFNGLSGTFSVGYEYNYADQPTRVNYTADSWVKRVNYGYTYAATLAGVGTNISGSDPADNTTNIVTNFVYRGFGGLKRMDIGNGRRLEMGYSTDRQQLTSLVLKKQDGSDVVTSLSYDYENGGDNNGRIQKITDNVDSAYTTTYGYDAYNRLTSASAGTSTYTRSYSFDNWGNLTGVTSTGAGETGSYTPNYTYSSSAPTTNRIINIGGGSTWSYEANGSVTNDGNQTYTYDAADRLKTASGSSSSYEYDGDGNRVKQANSAGTVFYLWSSVLNQPVVELTSGGVYRAYVYSPGGQMLALQSYDANFYWVHSDHLGSGRKLTNTSGNVVYRSEMDPHGQMVYEWASGGATYLNSHKFTGYERDWATNLDNANARTYHHNRARFLQPDQGKRIIGSCRH